MADGRQFVTSAWASIQCDWPAGSGEREFNRYSQEPIVIESPELRTLAVSGVFNVDDTESFVAFLRSLKGVGVEVTPIRIRVFKL